MLARNHLESLNKWLKRVRLERRETQEKWASVMSTNQRQIHRWENQTENQEGGPTIDQLRALARHLGTNLAGLIGDEPITFAAPRDPTREELTIAVLENFGIAGDRLEAIRLIISPDMDDDTLSNALRALRRSGDPIAAAVNKSKPSAG